MKLVQFKNGYKIDCITCRYLHCCLSQRRRVTVSLQQHIITAVLLPLVLPVSK